MTVKIDGTNGVDTAQLRAPDGDPVAITIGNDGKVAFPQLPATFGSTGSITLPNGLIIKWGSGSSNASGAFSTTFNEAFPTACVFAIAQSSANVPFSYAVAVFSKSAANINAFVGNLNNPAATTLTWLAIGY